MAILFIFIWIFVYLVPATLVWTLPRIFSWDQCFKFIHVLLLFSVILSHYWIFVLGYSFPWFKDYLSIFAYFLSIAFAIILIGKFGILYGLSAFLQQLTMISIGFLLFKQFSIFLVIPMIVPLFALCHELNNPHKYFKILFFLFWGTLSLWAFYLWQNIYLISAIHTITGAFLIKNLFLYRCIKK